MKGMRSFSAQLATDNIILFNFDVFIKTNDLDLNIFSSDLTQDQSR